MAYCRMSPNSEVYMYRHILDNKFYIHISRRANGQKAHLTIVKNDRKSALDKLQRLRRQGYVIPDYAFERLKKEIKEEQ